MPDGAVDAVLPDASADVARPDGDALRESLPEPWASLARAWFAREVACDPDRPPSPEVAARIEGMPFVPPRLLESLRDPALTPDVTNARRCLEDLRRETCFDGGRNWGRSVACQRLFRGSLAVGSACGVAPFTAFMGDRCAPPGRCESSAPGGCGVCRSPGECAFDADCPAPQVCRLTSDGRSHRCVAPLAAEAACLGDEDVSNPPCGTGLRCDPASGTCRPLVALGAACADDRECVPEAVCVGVCRAGGREGEPCARPMSVGLPRGNGCAAGLLCFQDGRCHPVSDHEGAFCMEGSTATRCGGSGGQLGLWCDDATHACRAFNVVAEGSCDGPTFCLHGATTRTCFQGVCQDRGGVGASCERGCSSGLFCGSDATGRQGVCGPPIPPGAACEPGGFPCEGGARCTGGVCPRAPPPRVCP